ncbi:MAG: hypothetical protein ACNS62_09980 [Candidatus Cyclobacteriaceae bacterium M3_2C_046]
MKIFSAAILLFIATISYGQKLNNNWEQDLSQLLTECISCNAEDALHVNPCSQYMGKSLNLVYQINDFYSEKLGRYLVVDEMAAFLESNQHWTLLGPGYDQKALSKAQENANQSKAVIAIYVDQQGLGHMSLIIPGKLKPSGTWEFEVPNSSSFFSANPKDSYINKGLSYAFSGAQLARVKIYARSY